MQLDKVRNANRPFTVGHPDFAFTQLPARDGQPHGEIQRSSRHPNCSYFTNWTRADDVITWDVEVLSPGEYEAVLYYACRPENVGAVVELQYNGQSVRRTIDEPHDPPLIGAEHDRAPRTESYVKDFRPLRLGALQLEPSRGRLTLRAVEQPGPGIAEVRLLMITWTAADETSAPTTSGAN